MLLVVKKVFADFLEDDATAEGVGVRRLDEDTTTMKRRFVGEGRTSRSPGHSGRSKPPRICLYATRSISGVQAIEQIHVLAGSSMRRMVPEMQAVLRGRINSKPSHETNVTYSEVESAMVKGASR